MAAQRGHTKSGGRQKGTPNRVTAEIKAAFRKHGDELVKALLKLARSDDEKVQLGAIKECLDRGWGRITAREVSKGEPERNLLKERKASYRAAFVRRSRDKEINANIYSLRILASP